MSSSETSMFDIKDVDFKGLIYLASPYTHTSKLIEEFRYNLLCLAVKEFLMKGNVVISPIVHCHPVSIKHSLPGDFMFWKRYNLQLLKKCDKLLIVQIPGWYQSKGINYEVIYATNKGIPYDTVSVHEDVYDKLVGSLNYKIK